MKKGFVGLVGLVVLVIACVGVFAEYAEGLVIHQSNLSTVCNIGGWPCVCGREPNSTLGYGAVKVGEYFITCDNIQDGICPEDYGIPDGMNASCASCTDYDCKGIVTGVVKSGSGAPLPESHITANPIRWNVSANLGNSTNTGGLPNANYTLGAPTGTYYFSAEKDGYDTQLLEVQVVKNAIVSLNFSLNNGTCHADCTNSYNRCNPKCDGVLVDGGTCNFYDSTAKTICANKLAGTEMYYGPIDTAHANFITCCEGAPTNKYYATASTDTSQLKNLVKVQRIAKYQDTQVEVIIALWSE